MDSPRDGSCVVIYGATHTNLITVKAMSSGWLTSTRSFLQDLEDWRKKLSYYLEVLHFLQNIIDLMLLARIILLTTWLEINLFPRKKWVIYGKKTHTHKKPKRNEHTEISLISDSRVAKAEVSPNLKTNAKSRNKTHTQHSCMQIFFHHLSLCNFE